MSRELLRTLLVSPRPADPPPWDRWDAIAAGLGLAVAAWLLVFKLIAFERLYYTSDAFEFAQLATSWLHGPILQDYHCHNHATQHTHYLLLPMAPFIKLFGVRGSFPLLALATGAACPIAARTLRLLGVSPRAAVAFGFACAASPISLYMGHNPIYGFHPELFTPTFCLALFHCLLRRRLVPSVLLALLTISIKEEMTMGTAAVASVVLFEELLQARAEPVPGRSPWNVPALVVLGLSIALLPVCLAIMRAQTVTLASYDGFQRLVLPVSQGADVSNGKKLFLYVLTHVPDWVTSRTAWIWAVYLLLSTGGLAALRPHYAPIGFVPTITAWLMDDSVVWPERFANCLAFGWVVAILAFASLWRARNRAAFVALGLSCVVALGLQLKCLPWARDVYLLTPRSWGPKECNYTPEEREQAYALFERYRRESTPDELVLASPYLYRFAHYENLMWYLFMHGWPKPLWILWDDAWYPLEKFNVDSREYEVLGRSGRFTLRKLRPGSKQ